MADNLKYNEPGAGPNVATDDVGSVHYQIFKLDGGANGATESITGTTLYGIDVRTKGFVSAGNSTTATLAASAVFVGTGEEVLHYTAITVNVFSDAPSVTGSTSGLVLEWSDDNTNWDRQELFYYRIGALGFSYTTRPKGRYFRLWYRNNLVSAQGSFRLQTLYYIGTPKDEPLPENGRVVIDGISYLIKRAPIDISATGIQTVITAVANRRFRIFSVFFTVEGGNLEVEFRSGTNVIVNDMSFTNRGAYARNLLPHGYILDTNIGEAFIFNLAQNRNLRGEVLYAEIP